MAQKGRLVHNVSIVNMHSHVVHNVSIVSMHMKHQKLNMPFEQFVCTIFHHHCTRYCVTKEKR